MGENVRITDGSILARDERSGRSLSIPLPSMGRVFALAIGKAAPQTLSALRGIGVPEGIDVRYMVLSNFISDDLDMADCVCLQGNHPFPDDKDIDNALKVKAFLSQAKEGDLVLFLLSGGASSLLFHPREGVRTEFESVLVRDLMLAGADIASLNSVRTFLSNSKGGGLLNWTGDAEVLSLIFSDVMGDDLRHVGSGPTYPNAPQKEDVIEVLERFGAGPTSISEVMRLPPRALPTHRKPFHNVIVGNNDSVLRESAYILARTGFSPVIDASKYSGDARSASASILHQARHAMDAGGHDAYVRGGETTVTVRGSGRGGRNLEMALSMSLLLLEDEKALCFATDGSDGNSGMAGAWVGPDLGDPSEIADALMNNDTAGFFDRHPGGIRTGPTGQNLGDLFLLLRDPRNPSPCPPRPGKRT